MLYRGLMLLSSITFVAPAHSQQQDTTKHGWGIVYSSPRSRASASNVNAATPNAATPSTSGITPVPAPASPAQPQVTTLPTIRGSRHSDDAAPPPTNGVYQGDRAAAPTPAPTPAVAPTVAAQGTYDTIPPTPAVASSGGGVHLDELMSLHEYTATGLTTLKPQEVQALEIWLERYRAAVIDSATRAAQQRASTSQITPAPPSTAVAASTRSLVPANAHTVTGIRSGSRFVQIDDGSVWDIYPADQTETAGWQVGDYVTVRVANQAYGEFDHELVNAQRTGPVRAKFMGYARGQ